MPPIGVFAPWTSTRVSSSPPSISGFSCFIYSPIATAISRSMRAKMKHIFFYVKQMFWYSKVR